MKIQKAVTFLLLALSFAQQCYACRFWCAVGKNISKSSVTNNLLEAPGSLKALAASNGNGWAIAYYVDDKNFMKRGFLSADKDRDFDGAIADMAASGSPLMMAHIRSASSGCVKGVPNPHPFTRRVGRRTWFFGHNGDVDKSLLIGLIGQKYLKTHPPEVCNENPPDSWVDSELYFILLLQHIENNGENASAGLREALSLLKFHIKEESQYLNFFISDGLRLWIFRKGNSLYYKHMGKVKQTYVASTVPDPGDSGWEMVPEDVIMEVKIGKPPHFISLK